MNEKWILLNKKADFYQLAEQFHIDPVIARIIRNREIITERDYARYLNSNAELHDPKQMKDMEKGVELIRDAIIHQQSIRIISDYDVDGIMSNYILFKALKRCNAKVDYRIPDRVVDGYGINEAMVREAYDAGVRVLLTCDNGISALLPIAHAKNLGMTVVVTDHHDIPFEYDEEGKKEYIQSVADAVIDPKQVECKYPFKELCGAAIAYKFVQVLYEACGVDPLEAEEFIDCVAVATICDVMSLVNENRTLVQRGLEELNRTGNFGLRALIKVNELNQQKVMSYHVGFVLGPCLNATGRLENAKLAVELLLEKNYDKALKRAEHLKQLNDERKEMTQIGIDAAIEQVETTTLMDDRVLVVYLPNTHESLAGIIAGRVRERFYRPTLILTDSEEGILKGSARSIDGYNMYEALTECSDLLVKYGGHPMAAGFSIQGKDLEYFRHKLNLLCDLTDDDLTPKLYIDVPMPIDYIRFDLIEQLELLEPFGKGNEKPVFAQKNLRVRSARIVGRNGNVLKLQLESETGAKMEGIYFDVNEFTENIKTWFGEAEYDQMMKGWINNVALDVAYYPTINEFNGIRAMQLTIKSYLPHTLDFSRDTTYTDTNDGQTEA
ncbi:MAG: single-stranded-DNA-specific exonuclease RecJ [Lachnospiraceae bacterium]|nr:single-stranded-DNA-specific exonuclease RecJ [Lachnospiraceae bacterium]